MIRLLHMILSAATADYKKIRADGMHGVGPVKGFNGRNRKPFQSRTSAVLARSIYISVLVFQCTNVIIVIIVIIVKLNVPILK